MFSGDRRVEVLEPIDAKYRISGSGVVQVLITLEHVQVSGYIF